MKKYRKVILWTAFALYCVMMIYLLFARTRGGTMGLSLVPFGTIKEFWTVMLQSFGSEGLEWLFLSSFVNLAGNVVMFVPLGFFLPMLVEGLRRCWKTLLLCGAVIVAVETLQFASQRGSADIDDFILNILGAALGYAVFALARSFAAR